MMPIPLRRLSGCCTEDENAWATSRRVIQFPTLGSKHTTVPSKPFPVRARTIVAIERQLV